MKLPVSKMVFYEGFPENSTEPQICSCRVEKFAAEHIEKEFGRFSSFDFYLNFHNILSKIDFCPFIVPQPKEGFVVPF